MQLREYRTQEVSGWAHPRKDSWLPSYWEIMNSYEFVQSEKHYLRFLDDTVIKKKQHCLCTCVSLVRPPPSMNWQWRSTDSVGYASSSSSTRTFCPIIPAKPEEKDCISIIWNSVLFEWRHNVSVVTKKSYFKAERPLSKGRIGESF